MKGGEIDFKINEFFVEYHPINKVYDESYEQYKKDRRKILNKNGLKSKKLFVFQNLKEIIHFYSKFDNYFSIFSKNLIFMYGFKNFLHLMTTIPC
jgi:hypothetical protein